jgi:hypothetical protein
VTEIHSYYHDESTERLEREHDCGSRPFIDTQPRLAPHREASAEYDVGGAVWAAGSLQRIDVALPRLAPTKPAGESYEPPKLPAGPSAVVPIGAARGDLDVMPAVTEIHSYYHDESTERLEREHDCGSRPFTDTQPRLAPHREASAEYDLDVAAAHVPGGSFPKSVRFSSRPGISVGPGSYSIQISMLDMHCNHAASRIQSFFRRHSRSRPRLVFAGVDEDRDEKPQDLSVPPVMLSNCNSTFLVADTGRGSRAFLNSEPRLLPVRPAGPEYFIASQPLSTGISAIIDPVIPRLAASKPAGNLSNCAYTSAVGDVCGACRTCIRVASTSIGASVYLRASL